MTTPAEAVEVLNRVHAADPTVLPALIEYRVPCNDTVADDPTVQVGRVGETKTDPGGPGYEVGLLGIVNGLFGINPNGRPGYGYIAAQYDEGGTLKFVCLDAAVVSPAKTDVVAGSKNVVTTTVRPVSSENPQ